MQEPLPALCPPTSSASPAPLRPAAPRWLWPLGVALLAALPMVAPWNGKYFDLDSYYTWATALFAGQVPYRDFQLEYPPATLPLFALPRLLFHSRRGYVVAFMFLMWAFDLGQKRLLWRRCGERRLLALALHSIAGTMLYFTYFKRFDVALAFCMLCGWDALWRAPGRLQSWGIWGLGVLLKLMPVFLAPLWAWQAWRRSGSLGRACAGALFGLLTVAAGFAAAAAWAGPQAWGWLTYHQDRGLQVGSTYTALEILRYGVGHSFEWSFTYGAAHLLGPWSAQMARWSPLFMGVAVAVTGLRMAPSMHSEAGHWRAATATIMAVILTSKVYSPQFTAWLVPFLVVAALRSGRLDWPLILGLLALVGFTAEVYPGEGALLAGAHHKQWALVARASLLLTLWGYLLATPGGLPATPSGVTIRSTPR